MSIATTTLIRFSSPLAWAAIAFAVFLSLLGPSTVRTLWRKERRHDPPPAWPWGAPLWRGYTRILLVSAIGVHILWWRTAEANSHALAATINDANG